MSGERSHGHCPLESRLLCPEVAASETLSYLDRRGVDAEAAVRAVSCRRMVSVCQPLSECQFLGLATAEANDVSLLGLHVAAEMDMRAVGIHFYLGGTSQTVLEALEGLVRYSATTMKLSCLRSRSARDEVILAVRCRQGTARDDERVRQVRKHCRCGSPTSCTGRHLWRFMVILPVFVWTQSECRSRVAAVGSSRDAREPLGPSKAEAFLCRGTC
jgi:hypothetical protein